MLGVIDAILEDDKQRPAKQRHTAKRIFDRLREEHGFTGGYGIVSQYMHRERLRGQEMFLPLAHRAGCGRENEEWETRDRKRARLDLAEWKKEEKSREQDRNLVSKHRIECLPKEILY